MAELTGRTQIFGGDTADVDTTAKFALGTRAFDLENNEYIYLTGVALTALGEWVTFDEDNITTLATANAVGRVAVAMAATVANTYGWYQIYGHCAQAAAITAGACAADVLLYLTATAGEVDDVNVAGDAIVGAISRTVEAVPTAGYIEVELNYPWVCDGAID